MSHPAPMCMFCAHFYREFRGFKCEAYPSEIPMEIIELEVDHREPYEGDNGIQFELDDEWGQEQLDYIDDLYSDDKEQAIKNLIKAKRMEEAIKSTGDMPEEALEALCESIGDIDGFFTRCMDHHVTEDMEEPERFCAWLHHYCHGKWPAEK